ncbi:metal-dependent transcriptional regulator [Brumimicrobium aurantiacum]|uniref:Transcriptional regulator MntR n=1 Tax=Brumimicrobium aurantiacum TaxID=1737063 RepID=A0A3E1EW95_9FLAO|nr:metal-dependent transcriptional regulator [Brumimicrobium aurantiacum]RFC53817.1 metal-dependent transcriptional regulator [Brumimicrobium aurantiacum]
MDHLTQSEENYIKAIYYLQKVLKKSVGTNSLAEKMDTKASSVTDMVRRLSEKSLIVYEKYKGCKLTNTGESVALKTIRKHRLWETFLVEKLNFGWEEVHEIAEQLEHIQSIKLTDKLDAFLDFPKFDPHGDPIPDKDGQFSQREETYKLIDFKLNTPSIVIGVDDNSASFLKYLDKHGIKLGVSLTVLDRFEFDNSTEVLLNGEKLNLSAAASSKITVQVK